MNVKLAVVLLLLATAAMPRSTLGYENDTATPRQRFAVFIGAHDWSGLADLQSADGGSFQSNGVNLAAAWHRHVGEFERSSLLVGGELGLFINDSSIQGPTVDLTSRGFYLVPSVKFAFGRHRNFYLDAGAGVYSADFAELFCSPGCVELDEAWQETTFGSYLGFSTDFRFGERWAGALEAKAHFVDFGEVTGLGSQVQTLGGPIYMLQVGVAF
jgi:hypothetical protein